MFVMQKIAKGFHYTFLINDFFAKYATTVVPQLLPPMDFFLFKKTKPDLEKLFSNNRRD